MRRRLMCGIVAQRVGEFGQLRRRQRQRIAAGQDDFVDRRHRRAIASTASRQPSRGGGFLGIGEMAAEAVAAMHRAAAGGDQQRAAVVLVQHAVRRRARRHRRPHRATKPGTDRIFVVQRQHLAQQRIVRIAVAHARDEAARHPQRELRGGGVGDAGTAVASRPSRASSSRGSRTASRHSCCQSAARCGRAGRGGLQGRGGSRYHVRSVPGPFRPRRNPNPIILAARAAWPRLLRSYPWPAMA